MKLDSKFVKICLKAALMLNKNNVRCDYQCGDPDICECGELASRWFLANCGFGPFVRPRCKLHSSISILNLEKDIVSELTRDEVLVAEVFIE